MWTLIGVCVLHVLMDNRQPAKTMAWVMVLFFLPVVGVVLYVLVGINHRRERLLSKQQSDDLARRQLGEFALQQELPPADDRQRLLARQLASQGGALPFRLEFPSRLLPFFLLLSATALFI